MLAVEKTRRINVEFSGPGSCDIAKILKREIPTIKISGEDEDELIDVSETEWYKEMEKTMTRGKHLWVRRQNKMLTQKQLSELTGISVPNISAMENDRRPISLESAKKFAKALGRDVSEFIDLGDIA